jgi:hypothetical protein
MSSSYPPWLLSSLALNMTAALTFHSRLIDAAAIAYGLSWLVHFHLYHPTGTFMDIYMFGLLVFTFVSKTTSFLLIKDRERDFVRVPADESGQEDGRKKASGTGKTALVGRKVEGRTVWRRFLDMLQVVCALRGVGW